MGAVAATEIAVIAAESDSSTASVLRWVRHNVAAFKLPFCAGEALHNNVQ